MAHSMQNQCKSLDNSLYQIILIPSETHNTRIVMTVYRVFFATLLITISSCVYTAQNIPNDPPHEGSHSMQSLTSLTQKNTTTEEHDGPLYRCALLCSGCCPWMSVNVIGTAMQASPEITRLYAGIVSLISIGVTSYYTQYKAHEQSTKED